MFLSLFALWFSAPGIKGHIYTRFSHGGKEEKMTTFEVTRQFVRLLKAGEIRDASQVDLSGVNLQAAFLREADLTRANLSGADLTE